MVKLIAKIVFVIDTFFYKYFGFVSVFRKNHWKKQAKKLQDELDEQHAYKKAVNMLYDTNYTTKQSLLISIR